MRCCVSRSLALVRAFSGMLGWVNNQKSTQLVSVAFRDQ
jgi:hypothetical protein